MSNDAKVVSIKAGQPVDPTSLPVPMPETVVVGPYEYEIRPMDRVEVLETGAMGMCNEEDVTISVASEMAPIHQAETLIHEILHAIWGAGSLADEGPVDEEQIITVFAKGILQVARDNPHVMGYIAKQAGLIAP